MTGFDTALRRHCQRAHSHQPSQMPPTAPPLRPRRRGAPLLGLLALASAVLCLQPPAAAAFAPPPAPAEGACWEQPKLRSLGPCVEADGPELNVTLQVGPRGGVFWLLVPATSNQKVHSQCARTFVCLGVGLPSSRTDTVARAPVPGGRGALRAATVADGHRHPAQLARHLRQARAAAEVRSINLSIDNPRYAECNAVRPCLS